MELLRFKLYCLLSVFAIKKMQSKMCMHVSLHGTYMSFTYIRSPRKRPSGSYPSSNTNVDQLLDKNQMFLESLEINVCTDI